MSARLQRLFKARYTLRSIVKRCCIATEAPLNDTVHRPFPFDFTIPGGNFSAQEIPLKREPKSNSPSDVSVYLASGYNIGGHLRRGVRLDRIDKDDLMKWGTWGIPISLRDSGTFRMWVFAWCPACDGILHWHITQTKLLVKVRRAALESLVTRDLLHRDNCRCEKCVNQDTMQKAFDTFIVSRTNHFRRFSS